MAYRSTINKNFVNLFQKEGLPRMVTVFKINNFFVIGIADCTNEISTKPLISSIMTLQLCLCAGVSLREKISFSKEETMQHDSVTPILSICCTEGNSGRSHTVLSSRFESWLDLMKEQSLPDIITKRSFYEQSYPHDT